MFVNIKLKNLSFIIIFISIFFFKNYFLKGGINKEKFFNINNDTSSIYQSIPIAVVGDLQRTSIYEYFLRREQNDEERREIVKSIAKDNPAALVILGDMIFDGSDKSSWEEFDKLIKPITDNKIPIFPVVGNHEYWGNDRLAMMNLVERFPKLFLQHWYTEIYDSLALIILDSNYSDLSDEDWEIEKYWFARKLNEFDSNPAVKGTIVFDHHPPFTNSLVTGDVIEVQDNFLPVFYISKKTLLFVSGHAHTYERFFKNGKMFVVSGGGGGPRVNLKIGDDEHKDFYKGESPRPFNYLLIRKENNSIKITVKGLKKGESKFFVMEEFNLDFNK